MYRHPFILLLLLLGFFVAGLFIGQFVALVALYPFLGNSVLELGSILNNISNYPEYRNVILLIQGLTSGISMILFPYLFNLFYYKKRIYVGFGYPSDIYYLSTVLIVICAIPAISWIADMNMQMSLPESFSWIESWAKNKEEELKMLTEYITQFNSTLQFLFGLLVIAIIPAVGEELLFRGMIQNLLNDWWRNKHVAIWVTAIIFSAIHFQFYGFLPRMLLGALLGYLFVWTNNLMIPILAHFTNNGFTLLLLHMKNIGKLKLDVETSKEMPASLIIGSFVIVAVILFFYKKQLKFEEKEW
ncbi:MAG: CPBP family intramembrane glutamic endopeptidase [Bacteroidota bacterium]|nr:CPBP family intramembrane glutamic endopeptidase [Bacteroidota bacterium]